MMTDAERDLQRFEDILKEIGLIRESLNGLDMKHGRRRASFVDSIAGCCDRFAMKKGTK